MFACVTLRLVDDLEIHSKFRGSSPPKVSPFIHFISAFHNLESILIYKQC